MTLSDRRQLPRKIASERIQVRDTNTNRHIGELVNLNSEGLMLVSRTPVESNLIFQLELKIKKPHRGQGRLRLGAESLWCSNANEANHFWSGYRIIDVSLDTLEMIESMVDGWETDEALH